MFLPFEALAARVMKSPPRSLCTLACAGLLAGLLAPGCSDLPSGVLDAGAPHDTAGPSDLPPIDTVAPVDADTPVDARVPVDADPPVDAMAPVDAPPPRAGRPVAVLRAACTSADQLRWYTTLLTNTGVPHEEVPLDGDTPAAALRDRALVFGCTVPPTELDLRAWAARLRNAIFEGSWVVLDGFAQQTLGEWGVASVTTQTFFQSTGLESYYLEASRSGVGHPLLRDLPDYPVSAMTPPPPFQGAFLVGQQPPDTGMSIPFLALTPRAGVTNLGARYLQITLFLGGTDSADDAVRRCADLPYLCNAKRALQIYGRDVPVFAVGSGLALAVENAGYRRGVWEWGSVSERIHLNALRWARGEIQ